MKIAPASLDDTPDPALQSWVEFANDPATDLPIQNLPFGRFRLPGSDEWHISLAIGDKVLDLNKAKLVDTSDMNRLMSSGTDARRTSRISGTTGEQGGSLLELTMGGKQIITLSNGETRSFLEDGDTVILRAYCEKSGVRRIGFGECAATLLAAR